MTDDMEKSSTTNTKPGFILRNPDDPWYVIERSDGSKIILGLPSVSRVRKAKDQVQKQCPTFASSNSQDTAYAFIRSLIEQQAVQPKITSSEANSISESEILDVAEAFIREELKHDRDVYVTYPNGSRKKVENDFSRTDFIEGLRSKGVDNPAVIYLMIFKEAEKKMREVYERVARDHLGSSLSISRSVLHDLEQTRALSIAFQNDLKPTFDIIERIRASEQFNKDLIERVTGDIYHPKLSDVASSFTAIKSSIDSELGSIRELDRIKDHFERLDLRRILPEVNVSSLALESSLNSVAESLNRAKLIDGFPELSKSILKPYLEYGDFVKDTVEKINRATNSTEVNALRGSLALSDGQLLESSELLKSIIDRPEGADFEFKVEHNLLEFQQNELLQSGKVSADPSKEELATLAPSFVSSEKTREALNLIIECNNASSLNKIGDIFKPTTKLMEAFSTLPWLVVDNRRRLGEFVDYLYFALYEGAGKDRLRFMRSNGGVLEDAECNIIWVIKHLRNTLLRHDPDHGREADIVKSWTVLQKDLIWLGMTNAPVTTDDYRKLQSALLESVNIFLTKLLTRLAQAGWS